MPRYEFTTGQVLTADQMNDLSDQTVMTFAGTAARGSAIPSPTEGMVTYRSDDDVVEVYNGTSFVPVSDGKILQVVSTTKVDVFSTSSTSYTDITGLSLSITPSSATSKILVTASVSAAQQTSGDALVQMLRDATVIGSGTGGSSINGFGMFSSAHASDTASIVASHLDSPNTTSSTTYKIQVRTAGAGTALINRRGNAADFGAASFLTLMEVAA